MPPAKQLRWCSAFGSNFCLDKGVTPSDEMSLGKQHGGIVGDHGEEEYVRFRDVEGMLVHVLILLRGTAKQRMLAT